jgi:hypothetical protein
LACGLLGILFWSQRAQKLALELLLHPDQHLGGGLVGLRWLFRLACQTDRFFSTGFKSEVSMIFDEDLSARKRLSIWCCIVQIRLAISSATKSSGLPRKGEHEYIDPAYEAVLYHRYNVKFRHLGCNVVVAQKQQICCGLCREPRQYQSTNVLKRI